MVKKMVFSLMFILILSSFAYVVSSEDTSQEVYIYYPTGDIVIGWGPGTGSGYTQVDEENPDETITYVGTSFNGEIDVYSFTPDELPEIFYVTVYARFITDFIGSRFCIVLYEKSTASYIFSPPTQLSRSGDWVTISYTWDVNPFTGLQWTYEDLLDLGVGICAEYCDRGAAVFCTQVYLEIGVSPLEVPEDPPDGGTGEEAPEEISIEDLLEKAEQMQLKNSLISKLYNVKKSIEKRNTNAALNQIDAFIHEIEIKSGKEISQENADEILYLCQQFITYI